MYFKFMGKESDNHIKRYCSLCKDITIFKLLKIEDNGTSYDSTKLLTYRCERCERMSTTILESNDLSVFDKETYNMILELESYHRL